MARKPKSVEIKQITTTSLTTFDYDVPANTVASPSLVITNAASTINTIKIFINDGEDDFLLVEKTIPAGIGKTWRVLEMSDQKLNTGYKIKIQPSSVTAINYFLSVSEISES